MRENKQSRIRSVNSRLYTDKYYLDWGDYPSFLETGGNKLFEIHKRIIRIAKIKPGIKVLDIGCGRGELLALSSRLGAEIEGIDYSSSAISFSKKTVSTILTEKHQKRIKIRHQNIITVKLPDNKYDRIFMVDLIEHLRPWEVDILLEKAKKTLKKDGKIIIHTSPNRLVRYSGFLIYKIWHSLARGKAPVEKMGHEYYDPIMHVNEQSPTSLKKSLKKHGYLFKIWLEKDNFYKMLESFGAKKSGIKRFIVKILAHRPFKSLFFNHIYSVAWKK